MMRLLGHARRAPDICRQCALHHASYPPSYADHYHFLANQLRGLLTATAYVLMQELRLRDARTSFARAQVSTLRERLVKLGVWLESSVRRLVVHLPDACPVSFFAVKEPGIFGVMVPLSAGIPVVQA